MVIRLVEQVDTPREKPAPGRLERRRRTTCHRRDLVGSDRRQRGQPALERVKIELEVVRRNAENDVNIRFAKKSFEVARAELQRCIDSVRKSPRSVSDSETDRLRLLVEKGSLEIEQAQRDFASAASSRQVKENECKVALEKLDRHRISAPITGIVVRAYRSRGEWVKPGDPVVRILRLDRLRAEGFLEVSRRGPRLAGPRREIDGRFA